MNKDVFTTFIDKYHLNGVVKSAKIISDGKTLNTRVCSPDKTMVGYITAKDCPFPAGDITIYDTPRFKGLLKILGDDISADYINDAANSRPIAVKFSDGETDVEFMLADESIIPTAPKVKDVSNFDVEIPIDSNFVDRFTKAEGALVDAESFTVLVNGKTNKLELIVGYSNIASNRVKVSINPTPGKDTLQDPISFDSTIFREVLLRNRDAGSAVLKILSAGIAMIEFDTASFSTKYFLIKKPLR